MDSKISNATPHGGEKLIGDMSIEFGKRLANPLPGEEVVISGLSGQYPDSEDVHKFRDNLFNKIDMVSCDSRRWEPTHPEIPQRTGKMLDIAQFDAGFFGIHHRQATAMDPMVRMFLETTVSAIFDAGIHPSELEGTNTGVFVGSCFSENEKCWFFDRLIPQSFAITGCERSMIANRVSYYLKLKGPSFICDTACSSSLYAFEHAYKAIRQGKCDRAIVGGTNVCLHPFVSLQFARLGVLSPDGCCKVFDKHGNGYARSEAVSAIVLQKASESKRIYATVMHAKTNCDGYKDSGITYPSGEMQVRLLKEFYEECDSVKPSELSFLEAHGTGTKVGDPEELQAIEEVFLNDRKTPLLIGSVKSNIGHTEPSSGLCSLSKAIIAFETGFIPPNLHFKEPRSEITALKDGRLQVVTEKTPFNDNRGLIGMNSFGFGGGNCHVLLRHNVKTKINCGRAKDNIPRLVCVSGRIKAAIDTLLDDVIANGIDVEHIGLLHEIFRKNTMGHLYRGYSLLAKSGEISRSFNYTAAKSPNLIICFGIIDTNVKLDIGLFMEVPLVAGTIQRIHEALSPTKLNITDILLRATSHTISDKILYNFTLQMILADLLKALDLVPNKIFGVNKGLSLGILVCAYFDGAITLQEAVDCAFAIATAVYSVSKNDCTDEYCEDLAVLISKSDTIATRLQQFLTKILSKPRRFTKKVIFDGALSEISSIYLMSSFGSTRIVEEVMKAIGKSAAIYEVGNGEVLDLLKKSSINIDKKHLVASGVNINSILGSFGRLYELGLNPQIQHFYPKIQYPVSRSTPMISPKIKWNHNKSWWVTLYQCVDQMELEEKTVGVMLKDPSYTFISGHVIDGRNLFPATGYLELVWETLAHVHGLMISDMKVVFENCRFMRACSVPKEGAKLELTIMVQRGTGKFEVVESGTPVVSGRIFQAGKDVDLTDIPFSGGVPQHIAPHMTSKDIYKELRLRGYNYKGTFRGLKSCDNSAQFAQLLWDGNWITFMDNMLQMKILQEDTRMLYVPTTIQRLYIDAKKHLEYVKMTGESNPLLPVYASRDTGIIRSGAIEIQGLVASSIAKRKYLGAPVLEKYVFMPDVAELKTEQAIRVNMQILLENLYCIKVKVVEMIDDATSADASPLGDLVHNVLADRPLIKPDITILSKQDLAVKHVKVEDKKLLTEVECGLVIASKILQRNNILQLSFGSITTNGFILSREPLDHDVSSVNNPSLSIVTIFTTDTEQLVLFRKSIEYKQSKVVRIRSQDTEFEWVSQVKDALEKDGNVLVYAQDDPLSGILGLVACMRREPGNQNVRLLFLPDESPDFDPTSPFYRQRLCKNLAVNVFKNGRWGTYRHLLLEQLDAVPVEHCYLNSLQRGDLTSLNWIEGPLTANSKMDSEHCLVSVYYASLNFRDVMTASGRINIDSITRDRREQECVQGFEFSGRTQSGKRVFGLITNGACSTLLEADPYVLWDVPDHWSLEEAATVPVVYSTCLYALLKRGRMRRGDTVLIHSGTGGIGQAAITLALHVGCTVYTTVGTKEKRDFLKKKFPQLTDKHIFSSRDTRFEEGILKMTKGRGVDVVLNSLAEEKLFASVRCLAQGGRFVEIGKFDLANNSQLNLLLLKKGASFHGLMLDSLFNESPFTKSELVLILNEAIKSGAIRPLNRTIFKMDQAEEAFRYMSTGKHIGKVMIQIRKEEKGDTVKPSNVLFPGLPRYFCDSDKTYIICGGLGGFGLELADWLMLRGCKKLILTSRTGIKTGYQAYRISIWKTYGCTIEISTDDITTYEGCTKLIQSANRLGPVHAIFNLAVVLADAIFQNQTEDSFKKSFAPKAYATRNLDEVSRKLCPRLRDFVVFSSVSCGGGNAGQSNYGMANSVMERICEKRRTDGFPALAIEWGAIADVGLVAEMQDESIELEIGGTLQQRISSCLQVLDLFIRQKEAAIVSSIVVAEKRSGAGGADNVVDAVANILGVKDIKAISLQATLAEVGMDSMTAVEIKQTLEREYEVFLTAQDIKSMTFARLIEIQMEKDAEKQEGIKKEKALMGMDMILRFMGDASTVNMPILPIKGQTFQDQRPTIILFPGIEGVATVLEPLYKNLVGNLVGLQYPNFTQKDSITEMAAVYLPLVEKHLSHSTPFNVVCYSFGGAVALELVALLEQKNYFGTVICIDCSPDYLKALTSVLEVQSDDKFQVSLIIHLMALHVSYEKISKHVETLMKLPTLEERIKFGQQIVGNNTPHSPEHQKECAISIYRRLKAVVEWLPDFKLKSRVILFKPTLVSIDIPDNDYGLGRICENPVEVRVFDGNHASILENFEVAEAVNECFRVKENEEPSGKADLLISVDKVIDDVSMQM